MTSNPWSSWIAGARRPRRWKEPNSATPVKHFAWSPMAPCRNRPPASGRPRRGEPAFCATGLLVSRASRVAVGRSHSSQIFQHQQLYDPGFPQRWRRRVLSWIAGTTETAELESQALAIAEAQGLTLGNLTDEQISRWLTDSEIATLDEAEKTARLLVRAVPQDATIPLTPVTSAEAADLIDPDLQSQEAVRSAFRYNDQIIGQDAYVSVYNLRPDVIIHHLARSWNLNPEDRPALIAAVRDRGFTSLNSAVEGARSFFLWRSAINGPEKESG